MPPVCDTRKQIVCFFHCDARSVYLLSYPISKILSSMASTIKLVSSSKCFNGFQKVFRHHSEELQAEATFSIFLPPEAADKKLPVLFWLSGLTCTEKNFIEKSGFQQYAVKHSIIVVGPDTSPRDCNIEGENDDPFFGTGAGFYVDATIPKWKKHYRMYSYVTKELPYLINKEFPTNGKMSICGHSMGGHGAIMSALKNPGMYVSVSAFAPILNPMRGPWGQKAFKGYLGEDEEQWKKYDSTELVKIYNGKPLNILIDQGTEDMFVQDELLPGNFIAACQNTVVNVKLRMQDGYDHGYYFVSTFLDYHMDYHAKLLNQ